MKKVISRVLKTELDKFISVLKRTKYCKEKKNSEKNILAYTLENYSLSVPFKELINTLTMSPVLFRAFVLCWSVN